MGLDKAIAGEKHGGVGAGVSPKTERRAVVHSLLSSRRAPVVYPWRATSESARARIEPHGYDRHLASHHERAAFEAFSCVVSTTVDLPPTVQKRLLRAEQGMQDLILFMALQEDHEELVMRRVPLFTE